jgi:hypothetical protein
MTMQTQRKGDFAAQNYTAFSLSQRVMERSTVKGYFLNRQGFLNAQEKMNNPLDAYGRNAGAEFNFSNKSGSWNSWTGIHTAMKPGINNNNNFLNGGFAYSARKFDALVNIDLVGTNYYTDMGFIERIENYDAKKDSTVRLGFNEGYAEINYAIFPKKGKVNVHRLGFENYMVWNPNGTFNEQFNRLRYFINFKNTSSIRFRFDYQDVRLLFYTSFTDKDPLPPGQYKFTQFNATYDSDNRKAFSYSGSIRAGKFYNADYQQYRASINYRVQPWGNFSINFEQNEIRFPDPYGRASIFLISPRAEINFSNNIFWTTFLQYNTQRNNFNINSRLQWRYKPMSDLFIVYTDNYFTDPLLKNKNRALVFKMNYWLNM